MIEREIHSDAKRERGETERQKRVVGAGRNVSTFQSNLSWEQVRQHLWTAEYSVWGWESGDELVVEYQKWSCSD